MRAMPGCVRVISAPGCAERQILDLLPQSTSESQAIGEFTVMVDRLEGPAAAQLGADLDHQGIDNTQAHYPLDAESVSLILRLTAQQAQTLAALQDARPETRTCYQAIRDAISRHESPPPPLRVAGREFHWGERTYVMGIVNLTPDSFSGDGLTDQPQAALRQAEAMLEAGADFLDLGAESTRPGHKPVSAEEEMRRLLPVITEITKSLDAPLSIDTYKASVAHAALSEGAHIINDIWAMAADPEMASVAAHHQCPIILMHNQDGTDYVDLVGDVFCSLRDSVDRALAAGIRHENIIVDPGIGFGKDRSQNLELLYRLNELRSLGQPLLLGTSRKSTIGHVLGLPPAQRLEGTAATVAVGIHGGADIVRVHDVSEMAKVAKMTDAIVRKRWQAYS